MMLLTPGANAPISASRSEWTLECADASAFGEYAAVALLPVDEKRQPKGPAALFQTEREWMEWSGGPEKVG